MPILSSTIRALPTSELYGEPTPVGRRLYLSGPMTGIPEYNFPAFHEAAETLRRDYAVQVFSPAELDEEGNIEPSGTGAAPDPDQYADFLVRDITLIAEEGIQEIVCLPGWEDSRGARAEVAFGRALTLPILRYPDLTDVHTGARWALPSHPWLGDMSVASKDELEEEEAIFDAEKISAIPDASPELVKSLHMPESANEAMRKLAQKINPEEVRVTDPDTGGEKGQKTERMDLIPVEFLQELSKVYGFGASKYSDFNYLKGYDWKLSQGALLRHYAEWARGFSYDEDSDLHHLAHCAWHCITLYLFEQYDLGKDHSVREALECAYDEAPLPGEDA